MVLVIGTTEMLFEKLQVLIYVTASFKKLSKFEKKKKTIWKSFPP